MQKAIKTQENKTNVNEEHYTQPREREKNSEDCYSRLAKFCWASAFS